VIYEYIVIDLKQRGTHFIGPQAAAKKPRYFIYGINFDVPYLPNQMITGERRVISHGFMIGATVLYAWFGAVMGFDPPHFHMIPIGKIIDEM